MATIRERVIEALGGVTKAQADQRATRAYEAAFDDANDETLSGDLKSYGYRRASGDSVRDLGDLDHDKVLDTAWRVFLLSPVARRYLQIKRDYILGRGIEVQTDDAALQAILDEFVELNHLESRLKRFVLQLHLLGEQFLPAFVRKTDGQVRLGYIDPIDIERVITHPDNVLEKWAVLLKTPKTPLDPWIDPDKMKRRRVYRIIRRDEGAIYTEQESEDLGNGYATKIALPEHPDQLVTADQATLESWEEDLLGYYGLEEYTGSAFYFSRNELSNQARGYTDLLAVADWIDQDEMVMFDLAERENLSGYFFADVTMENASEDAVKARAREIKLHPPTKGSVNVHNDKEIWNMNAPDLKQQPSIETGKELLTFVLGGLGLPRHWYGYGDETNRATAQAQGDPTWRTMENDQDAVRDLVLMMCNFVRDQAQIAGAWSPATETEIVVNMPEMTMRDTASVSAALSGLSTALMVAEDRGWIGREKAAEIFAHVATELGVDVNPDEEMAAADGERQAGDEQQGQDTNDWLRDHGLVVPWEEQQMGAFPVG